MNIRTQRQALDALAHAGSVIDVQTRKYATGGAAVKAAAARGLAKAYAERASIYRVLPKLYSGRSATRWLAVISSADSALAMESLAEEWRLRADRHQAEAEQIERQALPAFADDGMEYVPGRGRVRRAGLVALDGGQA